MIDISVRDLTKAFEDQQQHSRRADVSGTARRARRHSRPQRYGKNDAFPLDGRRAHRGQGRDRHCPAASGWGLVSQIPHYPAGYTVEDVLATAEERLNAMQARMRKLEELMAVSSDRALLSEYDELLSRFEMLGGYDAEVRRSKGRPTVLTSPRHARAAFRLRSPAARKRAST